MTDDQRRPTAQVPSAANIVLAAEKIEAFAKSQAATQQKLDLLLSQFAAMREAQEHQNQLRKQGDEKLDRSIDRVAEKIDSVAQAQNVQVTVLGDILALSVAAVNGIEATARALAELSQRGVVNAPSAQPAE